MKKTGFSNFLFFCIWFWVFVCWVLGELFLPNTYKMIFGLLILWQCTFKSQHSLIYFLKTQITFIKHILKTYFWICTNNRMILSAINDKFDEW